MTADDYPELSADALRYMSDRDVRKYNAVRERMLKELNIGPEWWQQHEERRAADA